MEWIDRAEGRHLDVLHIANFGLVKGDGCLKRKELLRSGIEDWTLTNINAFSIGNYEKLSHGKYLRCLTDVLLALNLCVDVNKQNDLKECQIESYSDWGKIKPFIQYSNSCFIPRKAAHLLSKESFASESWQKILLKQSLSYGYFCHYLDLIHFLSCQSKNGIIDMTACKNLIGPFERVVRGGGPDFVQKTFLSWAFFFDAVDFGSGKLKKYDNQKKLGRLKKNIGKFSQRDEPGLIFANVARFKPVLNVDMDFEKINLVSFFRFSGITEWRKDYRSTFFYSLLKTRIIYLLDSGSFKPCELRSDKLVSRYVDYISNFSFSNLDVLNILLSLEVMGLRYQIGAFSSVYEFVLKNLFKKEIFKKHISRIAEDRRSPLPGYLQRYEDEFQIEDFSIVSKRSFDKLNFEKTLPCGRVFDAVLNV